MSKKNKKEIYLTVDFEDYRYNFSRDFMSIKKYYIEEVEKQYWILSNILKKINAKALFYIVGEVAEKLSKDLVNDINLNYDIGSHSLSHLKLLNMSEEEIYNDTKKSIELIENKFLKKIDHYRAPYFSIDNNEINYYKGISRAGIKYSSSLRKKTINSNQIIHLNPFKVKFIIFTKKMIKKIRSSFLLLDQMTGI